MPGRVKTRLAQDIGDAAATEVHRRLLEHTLARLAPGSGDFAPEIWVDGDGPLPAAARSMPVLRQAEGDLGARMAAAFAAGVRVLVGSDIPPMSADYVAGALARLADCDLVLGPTEDGGYCLVGMNEPLAGVFRGIPWGSERVLEMTLERAAGSRVELLEPLWDVDTALDYARWRAAAEPEAR